MWSMVLKAEPIAVQGYEKFLLTRKTTVKVPKCDFVVCQDMQFLRNSPEGRVLDFGCQNRFGDAAVKCPGTKYHFTPLDAC